MKQFFFVVIALVTLTGTLHAQYLLERKPLSAIKAFEAKLKASNLGVQVVHASASLFKGVVVGDLYNRLAFKRNADDFTPNCLAQYFYTEKDTTVKVVVYEWDIKNDLTNYHTQDYKFEQQLGRQNDYISQYDYVMDKLVALVGQPTAKRPVSQQNDETSARAIWTLKNIDISLSLDYSNKLQLVEGSKTGKFRVRLKIEYKS